uniref:Zinc finger protein 692 isoform X7 n=1 Tax=Callorhinus ursinus TaxID=34884 RepID=A0A3Q7MPG6_CALUR|nr:zinc finger protein 692 isoform X7 [Callorhinus ursinus]
MRPEPSNLCLLGGKFSQTRGKRKPLGKQTGLVTTAQASDSAKAGNYSGGGEERACHSPTPGAATRPRPSWVKLWPVNTGKARGNTFATESWCPWLPPRWTHLEGGRRSGGSWTRAAASAASAWAATWSSGASSRSGWASPCTRSSLSSCWTGTLLQAVCSVRVLSLCPPRVCSIWCSCLMPTAESAAWCRGFGGPGAKMGGLCGSALQATPSPGAPLQAPYLQRSPSQCPVQILPREAGARRPGAGWSLQVWNLSMMRGLRRPGCPAGKWYPYWRPSQPQEKRGRRKMRMKRRCSVMPAHGPTAPPQMMIQMPPEYFLPLSPMHLRGRHPRPQQLPSILLLYHPHQHHQWVLELFCLRKLGYSRNSEGPLKQPSRLSPWPGNLMAETEGRGIPGHGPPSRPSAPSLLPVALGVRPSLL